MLERAGGTGYAWRAGLLAVLWLTLGACGPGAGRVDVVPGVVAAQVPAVALPVEPVVAELTPYFRGLRTVRLASGLDTLTFLLDTGGGHTLLTTEAARRLGCDPFGRSVGHRMTGERVEFQWCAGVPLELAGFALNPARIAVFDLAAVLPPGLPQLDGLLSLKSFDGRVVTIDLPGERLVVESEASAVSRRPAMRPLTARLATGEDGSTLTVFLAARVRGGLVWLLLDNGNIAGTILAPHALDQLGGPWTRRDPAGAGHDVEEVVIEVVGMEPQPHEVMVRDIIHDGVLGEAFMRQGAFMLDLRGKEPWFGFARLD